MEAGLDRSLSWPKFGVGGHSIAVRLARAGHDVGGGATSSLVRAYRKGMSVQALADREGVTVGTVRRKLVLAQVQLRAPGRPTT